MDPRFFPGHHGRRFPPNPDGNGGYFSFQAMQAGLMRGRPNLEALEMELREEMIREEIIARRIAQRRMMEEQAKREMEIAMSMGNGRRNGQKKISHFEAGEGARRFGPLRGRGDHVPKIKPVAKLEEITDSDTKELEFAKRDAEFEKKEKEKLEARPSEEGSAGVGKKLAFWSKKMEVKTTSEIITQQLSGTKRKAATSISGGTSGTKLPKPAQEWSCSICQVSATCEEGLNEHLRGKKHLAKLNKRGKNNNNPTVHVDPANVAANKTNRKGRKVNIKVDGKEYEVVGKGRYLWCMKCKVKGNCEAAMIAHLTGKRHMQEASNDPEETNINTEISQIVEDKKECMDNNNEEKKELVEEEMEVSKENSQVIEDKKECMDDEEKKDPVEEVEVNIENSEVMEDKKECMDIEEKKEPVEEVEVSTDDISQVIEDMKECNEEVEIITDISQVIEDKKECTYNEEKKEPVEEVEVNTDNSRTIKDMKERNEEVEINTDISRVVKVKKDCMDNEEQNEHNEEAESNSEKEIEEEKEIDVEEIKEEAEPESGCVEMAEE